MTRDFSIKEIAQQAGVGTATVDRVLNGRGRVRQSTALRVGQAIEDLGAQAVQLSRVGRKLTLDVIAEAPQEFLDALDAALAAELLLQPVPVRARRVIRTNFPVDEIVRTLRGIARRGSDGILLMAPDAEPVRRAVNEMATTGVPVITMTSDIDASRVGYVGLDNTRAGATAAWFIARMAPPASRCNILVTLRNDRFRAEEERLIGFREAIARALPHATINLLVEGVRDASFADRVVAHASGGLQALYSIGGNNRRILRALHDADLPRPVVVLHDLNPENAALMREGAVDVVLYHDLAEDVRNACRTILSARQERAGQSECATLRIAVPPMAI